ncbi:HisA/HisF-related TIM barrel protein [Methanolobus profundi]|uniref:Phosphoribosylformimino-5-aminoimidazole carboxamide ribotide isomerase n=1 Tax=Methanolobus profundi TaxID=487685 RepID=A0A1I4TT27_9EURY|nr:HisA/HisF-related TIM barrel protein [Methanolobus profundi]SFM79693.1 phosphoribosylformimino-5-aminoimidazole carboxamide ribotide isomerase [Methanolobus profundi]
MFRIIFVLDIFNRTVVHAQGGTRSEYKPIHFSSHICNSSDAVKITEAVKPAEVYIADLNLLQGIGKREKNFDVIQAVSEKTTVMLDPGITSISETEDVMEIVQSVVLGTETASLDIIRKASALYPGRVNVSIDKKNGKILSNDPEMPDDPFRIVELLNECDLNDIIILDLDRVGTSSGVDSQFLSKIVSISKHNVLLGGGVSNVEDIEVLKDIGIKGALVATALHNGSIPLQMVQQ